LEAIIASIVSALSERILPAKKERKKRKLDSQSLLFAFMDK
jgi:hypothetical protein